MKKFLRACLCAVALAAVIFTLFSAAKKIYNSVEFEAGNYTDYYYLTLDSTEKQAYTAVRQQIYDFPQKILTPVLNQAQLEKVLNALICDDPMMFMFNTCTLKQLGNVAYFIPDYTMSDSEYDNYADKIDTTISRIKETIPEGDDFETELFWHDYIINRCQYSDTQSRDESTVVGALLTGKAKCSGYAKAFKLLLNKSGIESVLITGDATDFNGNTQSHMWNAVKIDDSWCYTDTTWDDPLSENGEELCMHNYFNMTEEMLSRTHSEFNFSAECDDPYIYYYIRYGAYFTSCDSEDHTNIYRLIADRALDGEESAEMMFADKATVQLAVKCLLDDENIYRILEKAKLSSGLPIVTDTVKYTVDENENLLTIFFDTEE